MKKEELTLIQKELIRELKEASNRLGHSPKKRDIPNLAMRCYNHFGSFNKAKLKAGLSIGNVRITNFPKKAFKIDKDMARIASYVTFDGHLYKDLKGIMYSSKNIKDLEEFEKIVKRKFGLSGRYHLFSAGGGKNKTHKIFFFNKIVCKELFKLEVPKGDKSIQEFNVPKWIIDSKYLSREYLRIAFFCEGSFKENRKTPRISFIQAKCIDILDSGIHFVDTIREMLAQFNIKTSECYCYGGRIRKRDNKVTKDIRFRVKTEDNNKFIREIGWLK